MSRADLLGRTAGRGEPDGGLRRIFHARLPRVHMQGMELGLLGTGCPDDNGCGDGVEFWLEYKHVSAEGLVPIEAGQVGWALRRMRNGGRVFVVTWVEHTGGPKKGPPVSRLFIHEGWDAPTLKSEGIPAAPPVLTQEGRPEEWDWEAIRAVLVEWVIGRRA